MTNNRQATNKRKLQKINIFAAKNFNKMVTVNTILILLLTMGSAWFALLATLCFALRTPQRGLYKNFVSAKHYLGMAMAGISIDLLLSLILRANGLNSALSAVDLICFFFISMMLAHTCAILIRPEMTGRCMLMKGIRGWTIEILIATASLLACERTANWLLLLGLVWLMACVIIMIWRNMRALRGARLALDNYYDNHASRHMRWLANIVWIVTGFALTSITAFITGGHDVAAGLSLVYVTAGSLYIYISLNNYHRIFLRVESVLAEAPSSESDECKASTSTCLTPKQMDELERWIMEKGYQESGITISLLAKRIGCNRYYMSMHINRTYHQTFSDWIASLRIEDAKAMMLEKKNMKLEDVALRAGFNSGSYFNRTFKRLVGMSPARWKRGKKAV